jgi:hypothetical protein
MRREQYCRLLQYTVQHSIILLCIVVLQSTRGVGRVLAKSGHSSGPATYPGGTLVLKIGAEVYYCLERTREKYKENSNSKSSALMLRKYAKFKRDS